MLQVGFAERPAVAGSVGRRAAADSAELRRAAGRAEKREARVAAADKFAAVDTLTAVAQGARLIADKLRAGSCSFLLDT